MTAQKRTETLESFLAVNDLNGFWFCGPSAPTGYALTVNTDGLATEEDYCSEQDCAAAMPIRDEHGIADRSRYTGTVYDHQWTADFAGYQLRDDRRNNVEKFLVFATPK